jgi:hypothetical protein
MTRKDCQEVDEVDGYEYSPKKKKWFQLEWKNKKGLDGETCFMYCVGAKRRYTRHLKKCDLLAKESEKMREKLESVANDSDEAKKLKLIKEQAEEDLPFYIYLASTTKVDFDAYNSSLKLFTGHELSDMPCAKQYVK